MITPADASRRPRPPSACRILLPALLALTQVACGSGAPGDNEPSIGAATGGGGTIGGAAAGARPGPDVTGEATGAGQGDPGDPGGSGGSDNSGDPGEPDDPGDAGSPGDVGTAIGAPVGADTGLAGEAPDAGIDTDIVVAPLDGESLRCDAPSEAMRTYALALINAVRAEARSCGDDAFAVAAPLAWDDRLRDAAVAHSTDMATHGFFSHTGSDGSSVAGRVDAAGYAWRRVGENIAAGQQSLAAAIDGWVASPGHCRNLMSPDYTAVALGCAADSGARYGTYWTNVFARPR